MAKLDDARFRSTLMSERIKQRTDLALRTLLDKFEDPLTFHPLDDLMISQGAWDYVNELAIDPKRVFAHPDLLVKHPRLSAYYRGLALLPQKRVTNIAGSVNNWEDGSRKKPIKDTQSKKVTRLYNAVISSIIEGTVNWTLDNGYRNIIANMGIGLEGTFRNMIGKDAENVIKTRIADWLRSRGLILESNKDKTAFKLPKGYWMRYGSEPDIHFQQEKDGVKQTIATIEIKGGKDPAGALERLGAVQKSFEATPPDCINMLIAGVVTSEMSARLDQMGVNKVYLLDNLVDDEEEWLDFLNETFHYTARITDATVR